MQDPDWLTLARERGLIIAERPHVVTVPASQAVPRGMTEAAFTALVIEMAQANSWLVAHFRPARVMQGGKVTFRTAVQGDGKGFFDVVLIRDRLIVAELKSAKGRLRKEQEMWLKTARTAGVEAYVWRPCQIEEIRRTLA